MTLLRIIGLWGPIIAFMALVYLLAGQEGLPVSGRWLDKLVHAAAYGLFGVLCLRGFHGGMRPLRLWPSLLAILLTLGYGALDEWHQAQVPGRHSSLYDWYADAAGAAVALALWSVGLRPPAGTG